MSKAATRCAGGGCDDCFDQPGGDVVDEAGHQERAAALDLLLDDVDVDANGADRVADRFGVEFVGRDLEVLGQQVGKGCQIRHSTIGVMQDDQVPVTCVAAVCVRLADLPEHHHRAKRCWRDPTSDIADHGGLTVFEA